MPNNTTSTLLFHPLTFHFFTFRFWIGSFISCTFFFFATKFCRCAVVLVLLFFLIFALKRYINSCGSRHEPTCFNNKHFSLKWRITTGLNQIWVVTSKCQKENWDCLFSGSFQMTTKSNPKFVLKPKICIGISMDALLKAHYPVLCCR